MVIDDGRDAESRIALHVTIVVQNGLEHICGESVTRPLHLFFTCSESGDLPKTCLRSSGLKYWPNILSKRSGSHVACSITTEQMCNASI